MRMIEEALLGVDGIHGIKTRFSNQKPTWWRQHNSVGSHHMWL